MKNILLVIDPFLRQPASEGINVISQLHAEVMLEKKSFNTYLEFFFPSHPDVDLSLRDYFIRLEERQKRIIGVISIGSYANVTENLDWVNTLRLDLKELVIEKNIPFLGICFSHQLFAHIFGAKVDYVENREDIPGKKYNEFRKIQIIHPKLKSIQGETETLISKAKHEQEVKLIPGEDLELSCTSEHCKIEGLVHKKFRAFSIQSHPEEFHESLDGWNFVKKFIHYFLSEMEHE